MSLPLLRLFTLALLTSACARSNVAVRPSNPTSFQVEVSGEGPPLVLIPGLSCSSEVWRETVTRYRDRYQVHALTLAGFGGTTPIEGPLLSTVSRELAEYLRSRELSEVAVMGHSIGGFLALKLAAAEPQLVQRVIAVDGVPFLPALWDPAATAESAAAQFKPLRDQIAAMSQEQFRESQRQSLATMTLTQDNLERLLAVSGRSSPRAVADAFYELLTSDLRPDVKRIQAPVLELAAGAFAPPEAQMSVVAAYEQQLAEAPHHRVLLAAKARHFIMLDDPEWFFSVVDQALSEALP